MFRLMIVSMSAYLVQDRDVFSAGVGGAVAVTSKVGCNVSSAEYRAIYRRAAQQAQQQAGQQIAPDLADSGRV